MNQNSTIMSPEQVIEVQVITYNNRDLEGYMALFCEEVEIYDFPEKLSLKGKAQVHARYSEIFKTNPLNYTEIINRTVLGHRVLDHEIVYREGPSGEGSEMVAIYEVDHGVITRIDFVRFLD